MLFSFVQWWYGSGWLNAWQDIRKKMVGVSRGFSMAILLRTLFAPWRRITTEPGKGIDAKFQAMVDNLVSRLVGFTVRLGVVFVASLMTGFTGLCYLVIAIIWPLLPIALIYCVIRTVVG